MKYYFMQGTIFLLAATLFIGCEDDDDPTGPPTDEGSYSFTISGDIDASFSGEAWFSAYEDPETGDSGFVIWFFTDDEEAETGDNLWFVHGGEALPPENEYPIGSFDDLEDDELNPNYFYGVFAGYQNANAFLGSEDGTLTVTTSTGNLYEGTFSMTAEGVSFDTGDDIAVTIEGEFSAISGPIVIPDV